MAKRILWQLCIACYLAGCTTMTPVIAPPGQINSILQIGDRIVMTTRDGRTREFVITRVSTGEICGGGECIPAAAIETLQRRDTSDGRNALLVVGIVASIVGILLARKSLAPLGAWQ